ncbi:MAG: ATP-binding protein, partial [Synechococcales bacterium]|nr:ATP-binding protein [Synechococcales bacterium]
VLHIRDNDAAARFFGTTPEQTRQKRSSEMGTSPEQIQLWMHHYRNSERLQAPVQFEYVHYRDRQEYWLAATVCPIKTSLRASPRFAYVVEDITERKRVEAERRRMEAEVRQLNARLEQRVQERTAELEAVNQRLEQEIRDRKQYEKDLQQRATELAQVNQLLAQTTLDLERRNRELDKFAYVASHDLKAPLRAISNLSEWIEEDAGDQLSDESKYHLQLLRRRVNRMEMLIVALLKFSRAGRINSPPEEVDVNLLLADVLELLTPTNGVTIHIAPMPILTTQQQALQQIFFNLIGNAIQHGDRHASDIWVSVEERDDHYEFRVADNGPGIDPRYHDKIFEIFQTLKPRDELEAAGIGLSLVKKLVEAEGGSVWLESDVGQGATFYFTWPR